MTATIKDVAKKAGVGLGTVSRVLNNHPSVSQETRQKVLDAIKELEYNPNAIARSLKIRATNSIGVMIPDISSSFYPEIVRGIEDIANIYKYNILLLNTDLKREKEKQALIMLKEKKVDGILFISNTIDYKLKKEFQNINIPLVLIATKDYNDEFYSVTIDNEKAAFEATDYLIKLGHENIAMLAGKKEDPNAGIPRINGYKKALIKNNIKIDDKNIFYGDYKFKSGYENMLKILKLNKKPTAIFAASDTMAVGAASCAMQMGYKIPDDFSIIGFDGIELSQYFYPPLTTIKQPRYEMGAKGMEKLLKIIRGEDVEKSTQLKFQLIERSSCKFRGDKIEVY